MKDKVHQLLLEYTNPRRNYNESFSTILFTDMKDSSKLWEKHEEDMFGAFNKHENQIHRLANKFNGLVVKNIGDAFMVGFDGKLSLFEAIRFAVELQKELSREPISVGKDNVTLRIGIAYGSLFKKDIYVQGKRLLDYFGPVVNIASRLEGKVAKENGFAFAFMDKIENEEEILSYLRKNNIDIKVIEFTDNCKKDDYKRSARILTNLHRSACKSEKELKGVGAVRVYSCTIKN